MLDHSSSRLVLLASTLAGLAWWVSIPSPALALSEADPAAGSPFRELSSDGWARVPDREPAWNSPLPDHYRGFELDRGALDALLASAPLEGASGSALVIALPYPDGRWIRFSVEESSILEPTLAAKFPEIRTFAARGIDDPSATGRLSLTSLGFHGMVLSTSGTVYIDPWRRGDDRFVLSYFQRDARRAAGDAMICETKDDFALGSESQSAGGRTELHLPAIVASGATLRTYRLAMAVTGEYSAAVCSPNPAAVSCAMAAIVTSMNRVDGIYERDLAIRMVLIGNNNLVVYTNGATDPYSNSDGFAMLAQNVTNLNTVIGSANYDIGHVFSTGGGGVAGLSVVCGSNKARGVTGLPNPVGDGFDVDYVAHEIGHQFGGAHTFNGTTGACGGGNRSASSAYEPGSGSTIMAYAGICGAENLQPHSDDIFHARSFDQMVAFTSTGGGNGCAVQAATGNNPPVVNAGPAYTIPMQTPFTLTGSATDPDGDPLTYLWEEFDLGAASPPNTDNGNRPIFRSFVPLTTPSRTFPRMSDILDNVTTLGESLPTTNRTMTFRMSVRDNQPGGGGVDWASTTVTVSAGAGPFRVTAPNTAVTWTTNEVETVTWDVANTDTAPVSCANVRIDLSVDGGESFTEVAAASTPNDGSEELVVPALSATSTEARLRVACVGNVFFDVSNLDFTILGDENIIFVDGFESGDVGAWSASVTEP